MKNIMSFHRARLSAAMLFMVVASASHAGLPPDAQSAVKNGIIAAQQQDYLLALRYFQEARKIDPDAPEIYGDLGMAESKIPGRELRAIVWFGAYLAANPNAANAAAVRDEMERLDVKSQSNLSHLIQTAQDAALLIPYENEGNYTYVRDNAMVNVVELWAATGDYEAAQKAIDLISPKDFMGDKKQAEKSIIQAETELAVDKAEAGDFTSARKTAELLPIDDRYCVNEAIAKAQAEAGNILDAKNTASFIQGFWKAYAQKAIALAQAKARDIAGAQNTADLIQDTGNRADAESAIAEAQIIIADFAGAQKTVALISNQSNKQSLEMKIAEAQVNMSDVAGAQKTAMLLPVGFEKSLVEYSIAEAQAVAGDFAGAKYTAELITDEKYNYKGKAGVAIAKAQLKAGDLAGVRDTILVAKSATEHADDDYKRYSVESDIAGVQAEAGDIAAAQATAGQIKDAVYRGFALHAIAEVQLKAGDIAGVRKTISLAQNTAALIMSGKNAKLADKEGAQATIAKMQADAGDIAEAQKSAELIADASAKSRAQIAIAEAQIKAGDIAGAQTTILIAQKVADLITGAYYKNAAQLLIAQAQANAGNIAGAKNTLDLISDVASKITVEGAIAVAQAKAGDVAGAQATIRLAQKTANSITEAIQRIYAECDIAVAQAKAGDKSAAHATFLNIQRMAQLLENAIYKSAADNAIATAKQKAGVKVVVHPNKSSKKMVLSAPIARPQSASTRSPQPVFSVADWTKKIDNAQIYTLGGKSYGLSSPAFTDLASELKSLPTTDPRNIFSALTDTIWRLKTGQRDVEKMLWKLQSAQQVKP
jgi:hypothetical protein